MAIKTVQAIINGQTYNLTLNNISGKYEATITAPAKSSYSQEKHYYDVTLKATDDAGNTVTKNSSDATLGSKLKLYVKEKVAPTQAITYPTANALIGSNKPVITWEVKDTDSGINANSIGIQIDSNAKITSGINKTPIAGGYRCTYTPTTALSDGSHTVKVTSADNDGNASTSTSVTFKVDTTPPQLSVTSPTDNLKTNKSSINVTGTTNDAQSSPVNLKIKLNNNPEANVTVQANGAFTHALTLVEGLNTITIVATDGVGKKSTVVRRVTLDTKAPTFNSVTISPNPVDVGKTFVISIEADD